MGGSGSITVSAARECQWTAAPEAAWLSVSANSGQGDGTVHFTAAPNPDPVARDGGIVVNGARSVIAQAAAECRFEVSPNAVAFPPAGGTGTVQVAASSPRCTWNAVSNASWISIGSASGSGSASVTFVVEPTDGAPRRGILTVAGDTVTIDVSAPPPAPAPAPNPPAPAPAPPAPTPPSPSPTPSPTPAPAPPPAPTPSPPPQEDCRFVVAPDVVKVNRNGGTRSVGVVTMPGCRWTATSPLSWVQITAGDSGTGSGIVTLRISETREERDGEMTIAGRNVKIEQKGKD